MDEAVATAINEQIKHELSSSYFYLSVSAYFESIGLSGFAHWMRLQAREEVGHALKFFDFMVDRNQRVKLQPLPEPRGDFSSPLDACGCALENEKNVTSLIHELYALSVERRDYPAQVLLQWFVQEQVEEERKATRVVEELQMAGESASARLLIDHELASRAPDGG